MAYSVSSIYSYKGYNDLGGKLILYLEGSDKTVVAVGSLTLCVVQLL